METLYAIGFGTPDLMNTQVNYRSSIGNHENVDCDNVWTSGVYYPHVSTVFYGGEITTIIHTY